jgi:predicted molibdopterin-dependent oxidoreductase YjgC
MGRLVGKLPAPGGAWIGAAEPVPAEPVPAEPVPAEPVPAEGSLRLFAYPLLVDEGRLSERADELKATLEEEPFIELHEVDAAELGVVDAGRALVRTSAGEAELTVRTTTGIARGSAFVPFNQPGFAANTLLTGSFTVEATVEPAGARERVPADAVAGGEA